MTTLNINLDPSVLAHLNGAGANDVINISITLGETAVEPDPTPSRFTGSLAPLMEAGLLKPGDKLAFHQRRAKRTGRARLLSDGRIAVQGQSAGFHSPSKAAEAITGNIINGWTLWRTQDGEGPTLDELRNRL